jgi:hypothetical protein
MSTEPIATAIETTRNAPGRVTQVIEASSMNASDVAAVEKE